MANRLQADEIKWILSLDAKGVQSELATLSSKVVDLTAKNKDLASDLKAVEKMMKDAEKEMQRLERRGDTTSVAYQRASTSFTQLTTDAQSLRTQIRQNTQEIANFEVQSRRMINTTQIQNLTMNQLCQRSRELQLQLNATSESAHPEAYRQLSTELANVNNRMGELSGGSRSMFSVFKGGLAVFAGNIMTQIVDKFMELANQAKEFVINGIAMAKGAEGVVSAFNKLNNSKFHLDEMRNATKETISDLKLMEKAVRADEMGIGIQNMAKLMQFAQIQAKKMKTDVDYMANSIVDGLGRKSTLVLDNLGISATQIQKEVKKTGDFTAGVLKIVNERLKENGDEALTGAEKAAQSATKWENAQLKVGQKFQWLGDTWDTISGSIADGIAELAGETRKANEVFDDQLDKVAKLNTYTEPLIDKYEELSKKVKLNHDQTKELNPEQQELLSIINQIKDAIPGVVTEFDKYGRAMGINTEKAREFIRTQVAMLKYMNQDAIAETKENIENYTSKIEKLKKTKEYGGRGGGYGGGIVQPFITFTEKELAEIEANTANLEILRTGAEERLKQINGTALEDQVKNNEAKIRQQGEFNNMTKKQLDTWIKDEKNANNEHLQLAKGTYKSRFGNNDIGVPKSSKTDKVLIKEKKELADMLEKLEIIHSQKVASINKDYLDGKIKTEADYNRKIYAAEQTFLTMRESSLNAFINKSQRNETKQDANKQLATVQEKILAQQIKFQAEFEKILLDANPLEKEKRAYQERLDALGLFEKDKIILLEQLNKAETEVEKKNIQSQLDALDQYGIDRTKLTTDQLKAFELLEKQHQENIEKIQKAGKAKDKADSEAKFQESFKQRKEELQTELNNLQNIAAANPTFSSEMDVHIQRMKMIQEELDARKLAGAEKTKLLEDQGKVEAQMSTTIRKELEKRTGQVQQYSTLVGQAMGNFISGQETALKAFGDASIDIVFDVVSKIIEAELVKVMASSTSAIMRATAEAMATPQSALTFGASGFATAAILTGAITAATVAAKAALKGMLGKKSSSSSSSTSDSGKSSGQITVKQRAKGNYSVIGEEDNKLYSNIPYTGIAQTGVVNKPVLVGERGSELIVSSPDFRALQKHINYPLVVQAIQESRNGTVPQRQSGNYTNLESANNQLGSSSNQDSHFFKVLQNLTGAIDRLEKKDPRVNIGLTELQADMNKMNESNKRFTKR